MQQTPCYNLTICQYYNILRLLNKIHADAFSLHNVRYCDLYEKTMAPLGCGGFS